MLDKSLSEINLKIKLNFYRNIFSRFEEREASLTAVETFCVEVIHALNEPTISQFCDFVMISQANAAYKIQSLIKKGYVKKVRSEGDKREFRLSVTDKFDRYYLISQRYLIEVSKRINQRFSKEKLEELELMLAIINDELMPEIDLKKYSEKK